jgi:hypothetical protein
MKKLLACVLAAFVIAAVSIAVPASASADSPTASVAKKGKKNKKTFTVCEHGCKYKTLTKAAKKVTKKNSTIKIKPGKYVEGVIFKGHKYDGLTIEGTKDKASKVILEGKNAKSPDGLAQNAIETINVNDVTLKNMTARNYASNGFFVRSDKEVAPDEKPQCNNPVMDNLVASHNRSYGLFFFGCAGGKMVNSTGTGHGDSGFYVGATPFQDDPKQTLLKNDYAYENVLGYSGTNSKYITIKDSYFYNNGAGVVPNTLDSEPYEPTGHSVLKDSFVFWNNFNYYLPNSGVETVSGGLGDIGGATLNYPTGIGVVLFGSDGWTVKNNEIFGNFKWGTAMFSDPANCEGPAVDDCPPGDDAMSQNNQILDNTNGRGGTDVNAIDFWADGSGSGNCFSGNVSNTNDGSTPDHPASFFYPTCPAPAPPASGTGTPVGDAYQIGELVGYSASLPPQNMQCSWTEHAHPAFQDFEPVEVTPGPTCP